MTDEILSELTSGKRKKGPEVTQLFNDLSTMHHFGLSPAEWAALSRFDRLLLNAQRVVAVYHEQKAVEEMKKQQKREAQQKTFMSSLPRVKRR